jgi:hypothetical protein
MLFKETDRVLSSVPAVICARLRRPAFAAGRATRDDSSSHDESVTLVAATSGGESGAAPASAFNGLHRSPIEDRTELDVGPPSDQLHAGGVSSRPRP